MSRPPLPRDTRDTFFLLALIGWTLAPHLLRQPPWLGLLSVGVLLWRGLLAWRQAALPRGAVRLLLLLATVGTIAWTQRSLGRDASVQLLVALMALKTLELRARRDAMVLFFLGFFLVLTHFLYSQSLWTALSMGLTVWGWLTALTLAHMPAGRPPLREAASLSARAALFGTPVMVALFLLFPRVAPLWAIPGDGGRTGLGSELRLGDVAELATDDSIAMRLRVDGPMPPARERYLRGPVLVVYDGETWRAQPELRGPRRGAEPTWQAAGDPLRYELTLEPLRVAWLPLLELTPEAPSGLPDTVAATLFADSEGAWRLRSPLAERVRLTAQAWPAGRRDPQALGRAMRRESLALPPERHPRTRAWAEALRQRPDLREADARQLSDAVLRHIASGGYAYTLAPGPARGDPVDEFWLDRRSGFCEHYASTYVLIMRMLGVPARVVTGYQGGDEALVDGYLVIRQNHAHAWAEIWQDGQGWLRVDPTGAVAPDRIEHGRALRPAPGFVAGTLDAVDPGLRAELRRWVEALDNRWNQWVLGYGQQQQFGLLERLGWSSPDLASLGQAVAFLGALAALAGAVWAGFDARRRAPWQRLHGVLVHELDRLGLDVADHADPGRLARQLLARHGPDAAAVAESLQTLQAWRYGPAADGATPQTRDQWPAWTREFRRRCAALRARAGGPPP